MSQPRKIDFAVLNLLAMGKMRPLDTELLRNSDDLSRDYYANLNRGLNFSDNFDCRLVSFSSSATPDAENTISHGLGKVPTGYLVYGLDKAAIVYTGTTAWTATNLYLKVNAGSVAVKIIVF